jgi:hypothetical protein
MTQSAFTKISQVFQVDQVISVVVTPIVDDGSGTGTWVRSIRIFGAPNGTSGPAVCEMQIKSTTQANLEIVTPTLTF